MQSTPFLSSTLPCNPAVPRSAHRMKKAATKRSDVRVFALRREEDDRLDQYSGGHLVDRDMVVLRKRIHEMTMAERSCEPPPEWMDWEKHCYTSYNSIICEIVGFLKSQMMNARPSVVLRVVTLVVFSIPTSLALALFRLAEVTREILATFHLRA